MSSVFRDDVLAGRVALVTGGGSGIGKAIARALMAHGADTVLVGRQADRLHAAATELAGDTGRASLAAAADVRDPAAVAVAVAAGMARFGRIDVLVNGAAGNFLCPASQLSPNGFRTVLDIDAAGTFNASRAVFDAHMRDHGGVILNISATLHYGATPLQVHAAAAKAAVDSITRSLALEWGSLGIRVNGIAPGPIDDTEGMSRLLPAELRERYEASLPLGRFGRAEEVANVAVFLASAGASFMTGATVVVDGGGSLSPRDLGVSPPTRAPAPRA